LGGSRYGLLNDLAEPTGQSIFRKNPRWRQQINFVAFRSAFVGVVRAWLESGQKLLLSLPETLELGWLKVQARKTPRELAIADLDGRTDLRDPPD
jgi:hypothetical protein